MTLQHATTLDEVLTLRSENKRLRQLLLRYRTEIPLGNQPHMIAGEVDSVLGNEQHAPKSVCEDQQ